MPPSVIDFGIGSLRLSTLAFALAVLIGGLLFVRGLERSERVSAVDVVLLSLASGLALARVEHVLLNWAYFSNNTIELLSLQAGGLGWHGGALGALVALWIGWRLRLSVAEERQELSRRFSCVLDLLAPAVLLLMFAAWFGCWPVGCGYGHEVATLADYPALIAAELPDTYGVIAPRLNTPLFGMAWAVIVLLIIWWAKRMKGRFWLALGLVSLGTFGIGFARADTVPAAFGLRIDQILDLIICGFSMVCLIRSRIQTRSVWPGTVITHLFSV